MITIGTRIKYLRLKHGTTMKQLGQQMGFSPASADVRIAQYENDSRARSLNWFASLLMCLKLLRSIYRSPYHQHRKKLR